MTRQVGVYTSCFLIDIQKKMTRNILLTALLALVSTAVNAGPAWPGAKRTVTLSDGTKATLALRGDEHLSYLTDNQGNVYLTDDNGIARPADFSSVRSQWSARLAEANARRQLRAPRHSHGVTRGVGERTTDLHGKKHGLVILVEFQDQKFSTADAKAVYQQFFNQEGYSDYGMTGSVSDYFKAQSYGQFEIDFDIAGPYTASQKMSYYGAAKNGRNDYEVGELIAEVCRTANADVNYADYDWDGDGEVEQLYIIYAGYGENYGAPAETIWPHEATLSGRGTELKLDDVKLNTYACSCELRGTSGTTLDGIGSACHEFSHCLGLPDMYDTVNQNGNYAMANWDVMCQGNYNNDARTPAAYTSYERIFAGWMNATELTDMTTVTDMKCLVDAPEAYVLYNEGNRNEYYLLENRQRRGFDAGLSGHGLLVVHVDYDEERWKDNSINGNRNRQMMTIIPADGFQTYYTISGDPFPGTDSVTALTNYTEPAAITYNANTDGRLLMNKPIDHITESDDGLISFIACRPEMQIPQFLGDPTVVNRDFTVSWSPVADAVEYELELTETPASRHDLDECRMLEEHFSKCYSTSTGFTDISKKMNDYVENVDTTSWTGDKLFTSPYGLLMGTSKANGFISTPIYWMPESGEITVVLGGRPYGNDESVKGVLEFVNRFGTEKHEFELSADRRVVFHLNTEGKQFIIDIKPSARMYMDYLAIYEGVFTEEELGIAAGTRNTASKVIRRISKQNYTTDQTSYTFADLTPTSRFSYRIRAIGAEDISQWSDDQQFSFPATAVSPVRIAETSGAVYDLRGVYVGNDLKRLRKGVYVIDGKKVVID